MVEYVAGKTLADDKRLKHATDRLYITKSTAGVHVSNILTKLGVESRSQAAELASREELL